MIHVRDIREAINGLSDDAIVTAMFSLRSSPAAVNNFDLNLDSLVITGGHPRQVNVVISATYTHDDEDGDDIEDEEVLLQMRDDADEAKNQADAAWTPEDEDDEKKDEDYADAWEFNRPPHPDEVGGFGHQAQEQHGGKDFTRMLEGYKQDAINSLYRTDSHRPVDADHMEHINIDACS